MGITQQQLAVALGLAVVTVARWETSRPPSIDSLLKLSYFAYGKNLLGLARRFVALAFSVESSSTEEGYRFLDSEGLPQTQMDSDLYSALVLVLRNQHLQTLQWDWQQIRTAILNGLHHLLAADAGGVQGSLKRIKELADAIASYSDADLVTGLLEKKPAGRGSAKAGSSRIRRST